MLSSNCNTCSVVPPVVGATSNKPLVEEPTIADRGVIETFSTNSPLMIIVP